MSPRDEAAYRATKPPAETQQPAPSSLTVEQSGKLLFLHVNLHVRAALDVLRLVHEHEKNPSPDSLVEVLQTLWSSMSQLSSELERLWSSNLPHLEDASLKILDFVAMPLKAALVRLNCLRAALQQYSNEDSVLVAHVLKCTQQAAEMSVDLFRRLPKRASQVKQTMWCEILKWSVASLPTFDDVANVCLHSHTKNGTGACWTALLRLCDVLLEPAVWDQALQSFVESECLLPRVVHAVAGMLEHQTGAIQEQALVSLQKCRETISIARIWRQVFAGIYPALVRTIVGALSSDPQLAARATREVAACLQITLGFSKACTPKIEKDPLSRLRALSRKSIKGDVAHTMNECCGGQQLTSDERFFVNNVRQRVPASLVIILRQTGKCRSARVRLATVSLLRVLLVEAPCMWAADSAYGIDDGVDDDASSLDTGCAELWKTAWDICLELSQDDDDETATAALDVDANVVDLNRNMSRQAPTRILALIEELPELAQSQAQSDLMSRLRLVRGYLKLTHKSKQMRKELRSSMSISEVALTVQQCFGRLFEVEMTVVSRQLQTPDSKILVTTKTSGRPQDFPSKYLDKQALHLTSLAAEDLGKCLGERHATVFLDAGIADVSQSFSQVLRRNKDSGRSGLDESIFEWLRDAAGLLRFCAHVTKGVYATAKNVDESYLSQLAASIVPMLLNPPYVTLRHEFYALTAKLLPDLSFSTRRNVSRVAMPSSVQSAIAATAFYALDFLSVVFERLGPAGQQHRSLAIVRLLDMAGEGNEVTTREMAMHVLNNMAIDGSSVSLVDMMNEMAPGVITMLANRLRVHGGGSLERIVPVDDGVLLTAITATNMLRICLPNNIDVSVRFRLSHIEELVDLLLERFDHLAGRGGVIGDHVAVAFVDLYMAAICNLHRTYEMSRIMHRLHPAVTKASQPWRDVLDEFVFCEKAVATEPITSIDETDGFDDTFGTAEIIFIEKITDRCCFLLSHPSLHVQIKACAGLIDAMKLLADIADYYPLNEDDINGPKSAIWRRVATLWPIIMEHVRQVALRRASLDVDRSMSSFLLSPVEQTPKAAHWDEKRLFFAALVDLLSVMARCSGDFLAGRFKDSLWPVVKRELAEFRSQGSGASVRRGSDGILLRSLLGCICVVFDRQCAGDALVPLVPVVCATITPFIGQNDNVEEAVVQTLKVLADVDRDSVWLHCMRILGKSFAPCPVATKVSNSKRDPNQLQPKDEGRANQRVLRGALTPLMQHIEGLPEQNLL